MLQNNYCRIFSSISDLVFYIMCVSTICQGEYYDSIGLCALSRKLLFVFALLPCFPIGSESESDAVVTNTGIETAGGLPLRVRGLLLL